MSKNIKILFHIPSNWVDYDEPIFGLGSLLRERLEPMLRQAVIDKAVEEMDLPKITITPEEIKDRMLTILAQRALEDRE